VADSGLTCIICGATWGVARFDSLCEDCGVAIADQEHAEMLAGDERRAFVIRLDPDEFDFFRREVAAHPEDVSRITSAVALVHKLHLVGGCS
jgi:hypothetical protein